ncbi:MAG: DsrE/DsrF/DrsH-like family protein [Thermoproteus sp. AZ2]|jgi:peroxiredoxin family protein|uniref:DsrE/DsrF/DrsH-like family protein n=1 Tax=Thermoproteus sp. AZ2 TaxID=1609232 RepID=A0ACC6V1J9_9CREN|nr:MAG: peroxiredoxin [Thermoproteus sp. AZ2]
MSQEKKLGIIVQSGAANRLCCVVVYGAAALASGYKVVLHLVNEGLVAFRKDVAPKIWSNLSPEAWSIYPREYSPYVETFLKNLQGMIKEGQFKDWYVFLKELKEQYKDNFKIYACPIAAAAYGIKKEDLLDIVDGIAGAETFLEETYGGTIMVF